MENVILVKKYDGGGKAFAINKKEIFRYAGYGGIKDPNDDRIEKMLEEVVHDCKNDLSYRVCYRKMEITWNDGYPVLPFRTDSKQLAKCLDGSGAVVLFAATIGLGIDRKIARYRLISPTKALLMQAYGAERVERLCDVFCKEIEEEVYSEGLYCTPRFSPGYGDLSLETQKDVFRLLECNIHIGITLNKSLIMTPSKSVTAMFGLRKSEPSEHIRKCLTCGKTDCLYRNDVPEEVCNENN